MSTRSHVNVATRRTRRWRASASWRSASARASAALVSPTAASRIPATLEQRLEPRFGISTQHPPASRPRPRSDHPFRSGAQLRLTSPPIVTPRSTSSSSSGCDTHAKSYSVAMRRRRNAANGPSATETRCTSERGSFGRRGSSTECGTASITSRTPSVRDSAARRARHQVVVPHEQRRSAVGASTRSIAPRQSSVLRRDRDELAGEGQRDSGTRAADSEESSGVQKLRSMLLRWSRSDVDLLVISSSVLRASLAASRTSMHDGRYVAGGLYDSGREQLRELRCVSGMGAPMRASSSASGDDVPVRPRARRALPLDPLLQQLDAGAALVPHSRLRRVSSDSAASCCSRAASLSALRPVRCTHARGRRRP